MKVTIDENLKGKELFQYLVTNKKSIIAKKKSLPFEADPFKADIRVLTNVKTGQKADDNTAVLPPDTVQVYAVANTAYYCDSQMDVLLPDSAKRSINNNKDLIQHIHDHKHEVSAIVGDVQDITLPEVNWADLGVSFPGTTQVILFNTYIRKYYNKAVYNLYKAKKINQHSIGLQYVTIDLAINDPDYKEEFVLYQKYINLIANKDFVEKRGFFFVVFEIKLLENSAVLFGANPITPTLEMGKSEATKDAGTYSDGENQDALMFIDSMSKRHKKSIKMIEDCQDNEDIDDEDLMAECDNMKSAHQTSINNLQAIKESILSGKSSPNPDTLKEDPSIVVTEFDTLKAIRTIKFFN